MLKNGCMKWNGLLDGWMVGWLVGRMNGNNNTCYLYIYLVWLCFYNIIIIILHLYILAFWSVCCCYYRRIGTRLHNTVDSMACIWPVWAHKKTMIVWKNMLMILVSANLAFGFVELLFTVVGCWILVGCIILICSDYIDVINGFR